MTKLRFAAALAALAFLAGCQDRPGPGPIPTGTPTGHHNDVDECPRADGTPCR